MFKKIFCRDATVIFFIVLVWGAFCFQIGNFMHQLMPSEQTFIVGARLFQGPLNPWTPYIRYDAIHYLRIVNVGYKDAYLGLHAFFPGFPLAVRCLSKPVFYWIHNNTIVYVVTGLAMNYVLLSLAILMIKKMFETGFGGKKGWTAALLVLAQPYAFYYVAFYTEALFLFLTVSAFFFALRRNWLLAGVLAGAASGTRLQGILLFPAFLLEYLHQKEWKIRNVRADCLWLALCPWGVAAYLQSMGGLRAYVTHASAWPQRKLNWNVFYPLWRYFRKVLETKTADFSDTVSVLMILLALGLLIYGWRKLRPSLLVYMGLSMAMPMITTVVQAVGRYYGVLFPLYLAAGLFFEKRPVALFVILMVFGALAGLCMALFTNGYWVA